LAGFSAGQIVLADWRDALPKEPNKLRPAIVVEDDALFDAAYPNAILVPLTEDPRLAIAELSVVIEPTPEKRLLETLLRAVAFASRRPRWRG
jgi:mRNA-degrading endonuclease toxin of MazEF toxin-antitoxin module